MVEEENTVRSPRASSPNRCTPATMKRVADSQLTKDTEDGDDGPEVNGLCSSRCYPIFTSSRSCRRLVSASRRPQTPNSLTGGVHLLPHEVQFTAKFPHFILG